MDLCLWLVFTNKKYVDYWLLTFIIAADTNVNTGALLNLYHDFQTISIENLANKA